MSSSSGVYYYAAVGTIIGVVLAVATFAVLVLDVVADCSGVPDNSWRQYVSSCPASASDPDEINLNAECGECDTLGTEQQKKNCRLCKKRWCKKYPELKQCKVQ